MDEENEFEKWEAAQVRRTKEYQTENFISEVTPDIHVVGNEGREQNEAQDILARTHHINETQQCGSY